MSFLILKKWLIYVLKLNKYETNIRVSFRKDKKNILVVNNLFIFLVLSYILSHEIYVCYIVAECNWSIELIFNNLKMCILDTIKKV